MIVMVVASWYVLIGIVTLFVLNRLEAYVKGYSNLGVNAWPIALIWPLILVLSAGIGGVCLVLYGLNNGKEWYSSIYAEGRSAR